MKKILVLGAGLSASTLIKYLLDFSGKYNWEVILGDIDENLAKKKIGNHPNGFSLKFDVFDEKQRQEQISIVDVVISMLPAEMHYLVAASCVLFKKHLITASYVSDEIKELIVSFVIFLILVEGFFYFLEHYPYIWWWISSLFWILFFMLLYSQK